MSVILYEVKNGVALLTLNRPDVLNSINMELIAEVREAVKACAHDPAARVLLITGAGRGFCAGADLAAQGAGEPGMSPGQRVAHGMEIGFNPMVKEIAQLEKPVIAAVNGVTAGGGVGLALSADIVIAGRSAYFKQVFGPQLALIPDMGCTWFLPRLVGVARAKELSLLGEKLPAETALEWGLINRVYEDGALMDETMKLARQLAEGPMSLGLIRQLYWESTDNTYEEQLNLERQLQRDAGYSADFKEGVRAFLEKRPAAFKGK